MNVIIDTPERIEHFLMCQVIGALTIDWHESGSILKVAQQRYGCVKRTKKGALAEMRALYEETYGREYGGKQ